MGRKAHPLAARIKKMMQTDDDVGKIAQATPVMIARAMELFLQRLCNNAADVAAGRKAKTLTTSHLKAYVSSDELMDFLHDTVSKAPDLPADGEPEQPKPKRQRTEGKREARTSAEGKRASADGAAAAQAAEAGEPAAGLLATLSKSM
ncbi:histone-fold-containing protein [Scenedesmus sp. NREL 46B-D3]|nr:histone-fold-containing protein [Scenedesmus sp. NREL 46B-D3]